MPAQKRTAKKPSAPKPNFASIAVVVSDRAAATDWYTKHLGLDVIDQMDHWVTVGTKGRPGVVHLCQSTEYDPSAKLEPGNSGILFQLPGKDFTEACAQLKSNGVEFAAEPQKADWGWWATIRDPDGNEHTVMPAH
jgi:catechol 2,3-dioxygenase-like lactoylglutathione lyase family enzyme